MFRTDVILVVDMLYNVNMFNMQYIRAYPPSWSFSERAIYVRRNG